MRFKNVSVFILLFTLGVSSVYGQWDAQLSQYWRMKNFYNPSFIGETQFIQTSMLHRRQWVGISNAPITSLVSINMPVNFLDKEHGVGVILMNETVGLFSNNSTMGQYTYKFKFKKNKVLQVGLQGGMVSIDFDASKIHIPDTKYHDKADPAIPTAGGDKKIDAGLGLALIAPRYYVGLSATHLWEPSFDFGDNSTSYMARTYYLVGGYNIKLKNPLIEFQPSALFKTDAVAYQLDLTARFEYSRMFNGGISWRKDDGFIFLLGVKIKNIDAGYSYDLSTSAIALVSGGSHELFLRYSVPLAKKKERRTSKSIRIL